MARRCAWRQVGQAEADYTEARRRAEQQRRTDQALLQVIHAALQELLVVSFAVYHVPAVAAALLSAAVRGAQCQRLPGRSMSTRSWEVHRRVQAVQRRSPRDRERITTHLALQSHFPSAMERQEARAGSQARRGGGVSRGASQSGQQSAIRTAGAELQQNVATNDSGHMDGFFALLQAATVVQHNLYLVRCKAASSQSGRLIRTLCWVAITTHPCQSLRS